VRNMRTLRSPVQFRGVGLHTGRETTMVVRPGEPDRGLGFVRTDLNGRPRIPLLASGIVERNRQTVVGGSDVWVGTVEHLAAALYALGIDTADIEIDGPEVPGLDGSALPFAQAFRDAGTVELKVPRKVFALDVPIVVHEGEASIIALPNPEGLSLTYHLHYPGMPGLGAQTAHVDLSEERFLEEIAPARTFCLEQEARALQEAGLGRGATTQNTLVLGEKGPVDNSFRLPDEPARHKLLDILGDLSVLGFDLRARIIATRSGHALNHRLVHAIQRRLEELEGQGLVQSDTGLSVQEILKIIPHRYPFLFVDRVVELVGYQRAVGLKCVSFNEPHFQGHWPGQPIMPGVLQVEALAQLSGVLLLRRLQNTGRVAVLLAIDHIKFRRPVVPGDVLRLECETLSLKARSGRVRGRATVNGELSCEAVMKFMLMDA
jgi:UDP-3-O-[3-hydroxymyristoyl] N-acetylglucosamine deacetylase/3-hydroxyacyl-[acyl-carrier-protein] dehydratase